MDFGSVGTPELLLLLLLGLILFGPADWVRIARRVGAMMGRWQQFWAEVTQALRKELDEIAETTEPAASAPAEPTDSASSKDGDGAWRITM